MKQILGAAIVAVSFVVAASAGAASLSGPITIPTGCCVAPRDTSDVFDPNAAPVTVSGWVDLTDLAVGSAVFLGFVDKQRLDGAGSTFMGGAHTYVSRASATTMWIGPTDGNLGGEIVQDFDTILNETLVYFSAVIGNGQIDITWTAGAQSGSSTDTYGAIKTLNNSGAYAWDEFEFGAYLGVDVFANTPLPGTVDFYVSAVPEPSTLVLMTLGMGVLARGRREARRA